MSVMNQSVKKTILLSGFVLCAGFALLCFFEKDPSWVFWLVGACGFGGIYLYFFHPKKAMDKEPEITSILPDQAREDLAHGIKPVLVSDVKMKRGEVLLWTDQMRTDFYNSKPRVFYLTNYRLVCLEEDFQISHSVRQMEVTADGPRITITVNGKKMTFLCASPESFMQAWAMSERKKESFE